MGGVLFTQVTLANQALQVTCQSEVMQGSSPHDFAEELAPVVFFVVVKLLLPGDDTESFVKLRNHNMVSGGNAVSRWGGAEGEVQKTVLCPSGICVGTCHHIPMQSCEFLDL